MSHYFNPSIPLKERKDDKDPKLTTPVIASKTDSSKGDYSQVKLSHPEKMCPSFITSTSNLLQDTTTQFALEQPNLKSQRCCIEDLDTFSLEVLRKHELCPHCLECHYLNDLNHKREKSPEKSERAQISESHLVEPRGQNPEEHQHFEQQSGIRTSKGLQTPIGHPNQLRPHVNPECD